ncbi:MAG: hypothetical protein M0P57_05725 [Syntrophales bacterium]|jgi:hypothetical protein|nr:hypothetical protein [Syntrophales bacterium]MDY0045041.1 hypothetical protein [Syntrophales bacterium]
MSEILINIFWVIIIIGIFVFALYIKSLKLKKASEFIIRDLEEKHAHDPSSAIELPYMKTSPLHFGLRDYRPMALKNLIEADIVRFTEEQRFYLN